MANAARWEGALEGTDVPIAFVGGVADPVSGAHVLDSATSLGEVVRLEVGQYPHWEAPDEVAEALLRLSAP